ncbi:MAG TPA: methyltransferase domain-containing protein [Pseudomonadales bacterium]|nr:methyltransferase domain-containing protein [Pseudomonadales bacterium]
MPITIEQLQALAPWHFDIPVGNGLRTAHGNAQLDEQPPLSNPQKIGKLLRAIYPEGLQGKSFLDVACNGGGYSLLARDLGAERVFGFDVREHWINQAQFLLENLPGRRDVIRFVQQDLLEAEKILGDERFDICLFKGIFYHLPDPVSNLKMIANRTDEILILDTETAIGEKDGCLRLYMEGVENHMSGVHRLAWLPTGPEVIKDILHWLGFPAAQLIFWKQPAARPRGRLRIVAARNPDILQSLI